MDKQELLAQVQNMLASGQLSKSELLAAAGATDAGIPPRTPP